MPGITGKRVVARSAVSLCLPTRSGSVARPLASHDGRSVSERVHIAGGPIAAYPSSSARSIPFTSPGSALPPVFCITWPTRKLMAPPSPVW